MSRPSPLRAAALAAALILPAAALAGCGKTGELQRPKPLFGRASATPAPERPRNTQDPSQPIETIDARDVGRMSPAPSRSDPIQGQGPDPMGVAPPTALPNPYARPPR